MHGQASTTDPAEQRRSDSARLRALRGMHGVRDAPHALASVVHLGLVAACIASWELGAWPVAVAMWPIIAWSDHAALARLHEAVHHLLSRSRGLNELQGLVIGTLSWTPMSVYRYVHARHHAWLGRPQDPEFRPYSLVGSPLWVRRAYAWAELLLGFVVTPALYSVRTVAAWRDLRAPVRRRLVFEWALVAGFWGVLLVVVARFGWWSALVVGHLVPAWIAGVMQTVRKFTEHLGMAGESIPAMTRTVVYRGRVGRLLSATQLHVDHHGTHHRWPRIPWFRLPDATPIAYPDGVGTWPTHLAASRDALRHLVDPRVGPQWGVARTSPARRG